jgi:hypothetical protein
MVGRDRRARRKRNFPKHFATGPGSERRRQIRDGEDAIASAPGNRVLPLIVNDYGRGRGLGRPLGVGVTLGAGVGDAVGVAVGVGLGVDVAVGVAVGVGVGVGLGATGTMAYA